LRKSVESQSGKRAVFTICSNNYLAFAKTLLNSLEQFEPSMDRYLVLADQKNAPLELYPDNAAVIPVEDLGIPDFDQFAFRYDIMEFNTAIKPFAILSLLEQHGYHSVIYLDPDIEVFAPLAPVTKALDTGASVVLTPHVCNPAEGEVMPSDLQFMQAGTYNLGFCAWGKSKEAIATLGWWARRLEFHCVNEVGRGLFVDQKFIDLVPGFVENIAILRDPSLNVAYWNLAQRDLQMNGSVWTVDAVPLTFFHFSGFTPNSLDLLSKHTPMFRGRTISPALAKAMSAYADKLIANGYGLVPAATYAWGHFKSGTRIHASVRKMFREEYLDWTGNPFETFEAAMQSPSNINLQTGPNPSNGTPIAPAHSLYLRKGLNWLQFMYDVGNEDGAKALANWYVDCVDAEWDFDDRLLAPTIARLSEKPSIANPPEPFGGRSDISLIGYLKTTSGVGQIARATLRTLSGLPYSLEARDIGLRVGGERSNVRYEGLESKEVSGRLQIYNINADQIAPVLEHIGAERWYDGYKVAVPFWELDKFPAQFSEHLEKFHELWAPSRHIQALLYRQFRDKPIYYMPPDLTPDPRSDRVRASFGLDDQEFVVFFAFDFLSQLERKNPKGAYEAFQRAFPFSSGIRARFVLKTLNAQYAPLGYASWRDEVLADPRVTLFDEAMAHADVLALVACANVVLSLHRGEGLGLLIADAMGQNVPVVCTDWSGSVDLIDRQSGYPVSFKLIPTPADAYPYVDGHRWAEPDLDHAAWHLSSIYCDPSTAREKARLARANLITRFGAGAASAAMAQRLQTIFATRDQPAETTYFQQNR
jgi:glycosyltransferase involved in cell wall biosynthesis